MSELVVLLDESGASVGTAPKATVHHAQTPLHLAFSCWILDGAGRTLLTRRAAVKKTWPGAWTNSFCGHPGPGEDPADAVHRRALDELGAAVTGVRPVLPDFRYRAVMPDGTVENEICPVYTAELLSAPVPEPSEVGDHRWTTLDELRALPRAWLHYAQICDGPVPGPTTTEGLIHAARCERLLPGEGGLDLRGTFAALPADIRGVADHRGVDLQLEGDDVACAHPGQAGADVRQAECGVGSGAHDDGVLSLRIDGNDGRSGRLPGCCAHVSAVNAVGK